ncbi:hypothetical protein [Streptomyces thermospinosisporus]|uniref:hypothetical protein n=1 Tax=Streptomyces thermospinosisporus TaxID=161482 RepID=UPI0031DA996C
MTKEPPKGRQGTPCALGAWFRKRGRLVPELDDADWAVCIVKTARRVGWCA